MKKVIGWGIAAFVLLGIIGSFSNDNKPMTSSSPQPTSSQSTTTVTQDQPKTEEPKKVESPKPTTPKVESATVSEPKVSTPAPKPKPKPQSNCNPNYSPCVPNSASDLNCPDIGFKVRVIGVDIYHLDADHDGYGCDSY